MTKKHKEAAAPTVDPFLEPWSLQDCKEIGVDMEQAHICHALLRSGLSGIAIYEALYRTEYENSPRNNQQTHMHLADTLNRLVYIYDIDDDAVQLVAQSVREAAN